MPDTQPATAPYPAQAAQREVETCSWWKVAKLNTAPAYKLPQYTFTGQYSHMDDPSTAGVMEGFGLYFYRQASLWDKTCSLRCAVAGNEPHLPPRVVKFLEIPYAHLTRVRFSVKNL